MRLRAAACGCVRLRAAACGCGYYEKAFNGPIRKLEWGLSLRSLSLLSALTFLFRIDTNDYGEYFVSQWIRCGWIVVSKDDPDDTVLLAFLISRLIAEHLKLPPCELELPRRESLFRILRQLFALGLYRKRGAFNINYYLKSSAVDELSSAGVRSLVRESLWNPLSLQQLSRAKIRKLLGLNGFERRVQSLPLPSLLLKYVWLANEMLAEVAPHPF